MGSAEVGRRSRLRAKARIKARARARAKARTKARDNWTGPLCNRTSGNATG